MDSLVLYSVNIAMEAVMLLVLVIILVTLWNQKNTFVTTIPLVFLTSFNILMMIVQIITWVMLTLNVPEVYGAMPMRIVYILDYIFSYGASAAFYYYLEALAKDGCRLTGVTFRSKRYLKNTIIIWGVVTTIVYSLMLFVPSVYHLEEGEAVFSILAYILLHIISKFACVCSLVLLICYRKVLEKHEAAISFVFCIMISVLFIVDELCDLCIGHVLATLFVFLLYVIIDLHKGLILEKQEKEIALWKTQIMLSQMQPHFLYNVFTTISGMCELENATEARDVVNHFADYFRTNLDSLGKDKTIPFYKELEHIKTYLWLEKIRFEDELNICYEIGPTDFEVPSLTVQPMVENAVKHGIRPKDDVGTVTIKTVETAQDYEIIVEDDGVGFEVNEQKQDNRAHIGIENVSKRVELICNGYCEIKSEKGKGTIVTIHIPKGERI